MKREYVNLRAEMAKNGVSVEDVAQVLGIHRNTASGKVRGEVPFTIDEAFALRDARFPGYEVGYLFRKRATTDQAS